MGGSLFLYKQMFFSTTMIGVSIFTLGGEFWSNLKSYLFYKYIPVVSTILLTICMVDGLRMDGLVRVVGPCGYVRK